jgi:sulfatase maturation enzyme AslB (radical SAM superfamily)
MNNKNNMKSNQDNTFCIKPFTAIALKDFNNNKLKVAWPCCMMGNKTSVSTDNDKLKIPDYATLTPEEIFNHPRMDELRKNMLTGVKDSACQVCWEQEDKGMNSFRLLIRDELSDEKFDNPELVEFDYTASSACNLRCRMCGPAQSNSLYIDSVFFKKNNLERQVIEATNRGWHTPNGTAMISKDSVQWEWMLNNTDKIKVLKMAGGEPFYDNNVLKLLDIFIEKGHASQTELSFMTNGTLIDEALIEKLNKFKLNFHNFSIDGWSKSYDYIRYPATFELIDQRLHLYFSKVTNIKAVIPTIVISALNIFTIKEYTEWLMDFADKYGKLVIVHYAEMYPFDRGTSLTSLPIYLLEDALNRIKDFRVHDMQINNVRSMIQDAIRNNKENKQKMLAEITPFDMSRNQNFKDFLDPALVEWLTSE